MKFKHLHREAFLNKGKAKYKDWSMRIVEVGCNIQLE